MTKLSDKLHPRRFPGMSGRMAAIVGYLLGKKWTEPGIAELAVTSDGHVLAGHDGDCGCNHYVGLAADLERNWLALLEAARLTDDERAEAARLYGQAVTDHRPVRQGTPPDRLGCIGVGQEG
jgi:hypothetical protein